MTKSVEYLNKIMTTYHKIENVFERDSITNKLIVNKFKNKYFEALKDLDWVATEKVDGTNIRIIWVNNTFKFVGKSDISEFPVGFLEYLQKLTQSWTGFFLEKFSDKNVCLYGEAYGNKIQNGQIYRSDNAFVLFDIWIDGVWLNFGAVQQIAEKLDLEVVPIVMVGKLADIIDRVKNKIDSKWGNFIAEGVVAKPCIELLDNEGQRIITKIKTRDFDQS